MAPAAFSKNPYPSSAFQRTVGARYRRYLASHPFLFFGLPFVVTIVAGSFFLTPAAAVRYEKFDRKTHMLDREEALSVKKQGEDSRTKEKNLRDISRRKGGRDIREEYWKLAGRNDKLDDWEPKRVKRLPGEPDGTFD